ncbi:calcium-binding protein [Stenotrophomonas sp. 22385]|uniref:calcium-binding protein n=1 Tax=Stenotrophomonas sp. 22385 TaxID=3453915 RepID=UPI003F829BCC
MLDGGAGKDNLEGGQGSDTYRFSAGFGTDRIVNTSSGSTDMDVIEFTSDVSVQSVRVDNSGGHLLITIDGHPDDRISVDNHFFGGSYAIDGIRFADGTYWDQLEIKRQSNRPTDANQSLTGTDGVDIIDGGGGDDSL